MGLWAAPLESATAFTAIIAGWLVCWFAWNIKTNQTLRRITGGGIALLALTKIILSLATPATGIEARITPTASALVAPAIASPFRAEGPHGYPVYSSLAVAPYFINDTRRFDFYQLTAPDRKNYDFQVEIYGYMAMPPNRIGPAPNTITPNGEGRLSTQIEGTWQAFHYRANPTTARPANRDWLMQTTENGSLKKIPKWQLFAEPVSISPKWLQKLNLLANGWNFAFIAYVVALWLIVGINAFRETGRSVQMRLLALLPATFAAAMLIPIHRQFDPWCLFAGTTLLIAAIAIIISIRHAITPKSHRWFHAILLLFWLIITTRFFSDRYPGGFAILAAGSDTLFHYTFASEIIRGDWLHHADAPFSRQFFIRYLIALVILIMGAGPIWVIQANAFLYAIIGVQIAAILRIIGSRAWPAVPALWLGFAAVSPFANWIPTLFPEIASIVFLMAASIALYRWHYAQHKRQRDIIIAAIWYALAIYTRNNYIISLPLILLLIFHDSIRTVNRQRWRPALIFGTIIAVMVGLVAMRNTLLAPQKPFAILLSQDIKAAALYQGFIPQFIGDPKLSARIGDLPLQQQFIQSLLSRPALYFRYILDRIIVLFGGPASIEPNLLTYPKFNVIQCILMFGALARTIQLRRCAAQFPAAFAWAIILPQLALIIFLIGFVGSGYRFVLPCYPFLMILLFIKTPQRES